MMRRLKVTVSGSFNRHMPGIETAVSGFNRAGFDVLSPKCPVLVDEVADFLFVESDRSRDPKAVQDGHLHAIKASDLLWLVSPDGYLGPSASLEIGYAIAHRIPILCGDPIKDPTLRYYVQFCPDHQTAAAHALRRKRRLILRTFFRNLFPLWAPVQALETRTG